MITYLTYLFSLYNWACKSKTDIDFYIFFFLKMEKIIRFLKQPKLCVEPVHIIQNVNNRFDTIKYIRFI